MSEYWEKRIANNTWKTYNDTQERNIELLSMYQEASENISKELYKVTEKVNNGKEITLSDMHKNNRLSGLQDNIENIIENLGEKVEDFSKKGMQDAFEGVYKDISKAINKNPFTIPNKRVMEEILDRPWHGGSFSSRLWKNTGVLANTLNEDLKIGLQQGKTIAEISINLANKMQQGFNITHRLVRTETMHYLNNSTLRAYKDKGVSEIQIWVAKDERLCEHCNSYHEKVYPIDKAPVVPFHANCRCTYLPVIGEDKTTSETRQKLKNANVEYRKVEKFTKIPTELEIIQRLGGGDLTDGSCSSLAFAYAGNINGLNVLDFRDGISRKIFANNDTINDIANLPGVKGIITKNYNDFTSVKGLLENVEINKNYYLGTGRHAAIIRKTEIGFEYLELQSAIENGFKTLNDSVLKKRFSCQKSYTSYKKKYQVTSQLIECESLKNNDEFKELLGYINTAEKNQAKGVEGFVK